MRPKLNPGGIANGLHAAQVSLHGIGINEDGGRGNFFNGLNHAGEVKERCYGVEKYSY